MDTTGIRNKVDSELAAIDQWEDHPLTKQVLLDNKDEQEKVINLLCNEAVYDIETFFAHFAAIGHLRGLRRMSAVIQSAREEVKTQLEGAE